MILPLPWQCGQVCWMLKKPCCMRTWPCRCRCRRSWRWCPAWRRCHAGAFLPGRDADLRLGAARGLFERDLQVVAQVGAAVDAGPPAAAAAAGRAEDVAEDVAEGVGEAADSRPGRRHRPAMPGRRRRGRTGRRRALLRVGEHLVGLLGLLELLFGRLVVRGCGPGGASSPACGTPS
jgi:hypothetical protein